MIVRLSKNGDFKEQSIKKVKTSMYVNPIYSEDLKKLAPTVSKMFKDKVAADLARALNKGCAR